MRHFSKEIQTVGFVTNNIALPFTITHRCTFFYSNFIPRSCHFLCIRFHFWDMAWARHVTNTAFYLSQISAKIERYLAFFFQATAPRNLYGSICNMVRKRLIIVKSFTVFVKKVKGIKLYFWICFSLLVSLYFEHTFLKCSYCLSSLNY